MNGCLRTLGLLLLLVLLLCGCEARKKGKPHMSEVERLPRVETVVLGKPARLEVVRSYTATVEAFEKADLCAMVKGYIKQVPPRLEIGRSVKKDELLLTLDVPDLVSDRDYKKALVEQSNSAEALAMQSVAVAQAEIREANALLQRYEAEVEYRKAQHTRLSRLARGDTISQQQVDEALLQFKAASAALTAGQAQVVTKQQRWQAAEKEQRLAASRVKSARTDLERAEVQVQFATLRAPFDGVLSKRWVDSGTTVKDAGMPLLTFLRTDRVRILIDLPERDVPYVQTGPQGNKVELEIPALRELGRGTKFQGTLTAIAESLDPVTRTMRAEMHLDNPLVAKEELDKGSTQLRLLRPQMTGSASVTLAVREAFLVPASALVRSGNKMVIYIVADPTGVPPRGIVKRLEVQLGLDDGQSVEIRNDRLTGRELVIAKGAGVLRPGDQVSAIPTRVPE